LPLIGLYIHRSVFLLLFSADFSEFFFKTNVLLFCLQASYLHVGAGGSTLKLAKSARDNVKLDGYVMFPAELLCLRSRVAPYQISTFVGLKVPWRNQHYIAFPYPHASLHLAADATQTFMSVLTLNKNTVKTKQFDGYT
jgi:hypothetical protein